MRVLFFLLEILFFFLIAAALLRTWMNHLRVQMSAQPGRLVMAVSDWLVRPLRRVLPRTLAQGRVDWGSFLAAVVLALAYGGAVQLMMTLFSDAVDFSLPALVSTALRMLLRVFLQGWMFLLLAYGILSWVQPQAPVLETLDRLVAPVLRPVRKVVPLVGGVDLSVLVVLILLQVGLILLG